MHVCRFTDAQLEQLAGRYRTNADESQQASWPKANPDHYRKTQIDLAEMAEELLDRRRLHGVDS